MTQISLRAYNQEIDRLIGQGQLEEAIAHCRYILKQFPKHLETYRLLGKACLEGQRYAEAADVFQRVLAVVPDDYVANLGMSVIRENEGNLDAAIWHMERAFEVQPSNRVVQDELGRLYKRRDGVAPQKIRLTRGALVRMYERGSLFSQAIAEARAALAEEPERIDIEVILARIYHHLGQKVEAAAAASRLIGTLPFCYEANRVLVDILPETPRSEDTQVYQQNLEALDPYFAFTSVDAPTPDKVADSAVMLEHLDWLPARPPAPEAPEPETPPASPATEESLPTWPGIPSFGTEVTAEETPEESEPILAGEQGTESAEEPAAGFMPFTLSEESEAAEEAVSESVPFTVPEESETIEESSSEFTPLTPAEESEPASEPILFTLPEEGGATEEQPSEFTPFAPPEEDGEVEEPSSEFTPFTLPVEGGPAEELPSESAPFTLRKKANRRRSHLPSPCRLRYRKKVKQRKSRYLSHVIHIAGRRRISAEEPPSESTSFTLPEENEPAEEPSSEFTPFTLPEEGESAEEPPSESTSFTLPEENEPAEEPSSEFTPFTLLEKGGAAAEPSSESTPFTLPEESDLPEFPPERGTAASPFLAGAENLSGWIQTPDWFAAPDEPPDEAGNKPPFEGSAAEEAAETSIPDWLRDLEPESMEPSPLQDEEGLRKLEDLLASMNQTGSSSPTGGNEMESKKKTKPLTTPPDREQAPDWRHESAEPPAPPPEDEQAAIPEWLRESFMEPEASVEDTAEIKLPPKDIASEASIEIPPMAEAVPEISPEPAIEEEEPLPAKADETNDIDAALAWLESLAARQGAEQGPTPAEESPEQEPRQEAQPGPDADAEEFSEPDLGGSFREGEPEPPMWGPMADSSEDFGEESGAEDTQEVQTPPTMAPLESGGESLPEWMRSILDAEDAMVSEESEAPESAAPESEATEPQPGGPDDLWASDEEFEEITLSRITREQEEQSGSDTHLTGTWPDWMRNKPGAAESIETSPEEPRETEAEGPGESEPDQALPQWLQNLDQAEENAPETEETEAAATPPTEAPVSEEQGLYEQAQAALQGDDLKTAAERYGALVAANERLPEVIADLENAVSQHPDDLSLWQTLGDAYFRSDRLQDALEAYHRAEELLR